jgi:hypothetical protein
MHSECEAGRCYVVKLNGEYGTILKIAIGMKATTDKDVKASENMKDWECRFKDENFRLTNGVKPHHHLINTYGNPHA